ncbi:MAG: hypothetical protein ACOYOO_14760, partial [Saprospiraceae bacterium]
MWNGKDLFDQSDHSPMGKMIYLKVPPSYPGVILSGFSRGCVKRFCRLRRQNIIFRDTSFLKFRFA